MEIAIVVLLLVAGVAAWLFYKKRARPSPTSRLPTLRLQGGGKYESVVAGVGRYRAALEKLCPASQSEATIVDALLVPEPTNKKGVRVEVGGHTVGYLPTELAEAYRIRLVESGYPGSNSICKAKIISRMQSSMGGHADYSVRLDLPQKR